MNWILTALLALSVNARSPEAESVRRAIRPHLPQVKKCYEASGAKEEGKLVMTWTINAEGNVDNASYDEKKSTLKDSKTRDCLIEALKAWKFEAPPANSTASISFPFYFTPSSYAKDANIALSRDLAKNVDVNRCYIKTPEGQEQKKLIIDFTLQFEKGRVKSANSTERHGVTFSTEMVECMTKVFTTLQFSPKGSEEKITLYFPNEVSRKIAKKKF